MAAALEGIQQGYYMTSFNMVLHDISQHGYSMTLLKMVVT